MRSGVRRCGRPNHSTSPGAMPLMAATCSSLAFKTVTPPGTKPLTISDFACAMRSAEPNSPRCATPTFSTTAMSGGTRLVRLAISPTWLAPISATRKRVPALTFNAVNGKPISLLNEPTGATVSPMADSNDAIRSLVVVLPTEPVMPITVNGEPIARRRSRLCLANSPSARTVSSTTICGTPASATS